MGNRTIRIGVRIKEPNGGHSACPFQKEGDIYKGTIINDNRLEYSQGYSAPSSHWREATPAEITAYNMGVRNIDDMLIDSSGVDQDWLDQISN